ncbi:MAG: DUF3179 domain-containing (seleno)protein [Bacteroidota bacterium]
MPNNEARTRFPLVPYYRYMFIPGLLLLMIPGMLKTYLLMPFPGSQDLESIRMVYYLLPWVMPLHIVGFLLVILPILNSIINGKIWKKIGMLLLCLVCGAILWFTEVKFTAGNIFREPATVAFVKASASGLPPETLVMGVEHGGVAKAYPIDYLAYHHKVQDTIGGLPVLVTYCTMCRTGATFQPVIDNQPLNFRLIGANHYNAIFQDRATGSLWYQATGEAAVGPLQGKRMPLVPSQQVTLGVWLREHPESLVFVADRESREGYGMTEGFADIRPGKEYYATADSNWKMRSWVVGVEIGREARAYPWPALVRQRVINDSVGGVPVVIALENDSISYHVWKRDLNGRTFQFAPDPTGKNLLEMTNGSLWNWDGYCVEGADAGTRLEPVTASQEFWHAWSQFHPGTLRWEETR